MKMHEAVFRCSDYMFQAPAASVSRCPQLVHGQCNEEHAIRSSFREEEVMFLSSFAQTSKWLHASSPAGERRGWQWWGNQLIMPNILCPFSTSWHFGFLSKGPACCRYAFLKAIEAIVPGSVGMRQVHRPPFKPNRRMVNAIENCNKVCLRIASSRNILETCSMRWSEGSSNGEEAAIKPYNPGTCPNFGVHALTSLLACCAY